MSALLDAIKAARPNLSASSLKTYASVLGSLHKKVFGGEPLHLNDFDDVDRILHFLRDKPAASRKTILAALVVLTSNEKFRTAMSHDITTYNEDIAKQVASPAQKAAEISPDEIRAIYEKLVGDTSQLWTKRHQTVSDLLALQDSVILALLGGMFIAPRRSLDFCAMKIKNVDKETGNYIEKTNLVFNSYKTSKTYGRQEVPIPKELTVILKRWIKIDPSDFLLFDSRFQPLTSVKLNQRLNRIFGGRRISINALRHSYLSSKFTAFSKEQKEVAATMSAMGSSPAVLNSYVKLS